MATKLKKTSDVMNYIRNPEVGVGVRLGKLRGDLVTIRCDPALGRVRVDGTLNRRVLDCLMMAMIGGYVDRTSVSWPDSAGPTNHRLQIVLQDYSHQKSPAP